jgi:hypothetical protein
MMSQSRKREAEQGNGSAEAIYSLLWLASSFSYFIFAFSPIVVNHFLWLIIRDLLCSNPPHLLFTLTAFSQNPTKLNSNFTLLLHLGERHIIMVRKTG